MILAKYLVNYLDPRFVTNLNFQVGDLPSVVTCSTLTTDSFALQVRADDLAPGSAEVWQPVYRDGAAVALNSISNEVTIYVPGFYRFVRTGAADNVVMTLFASTDNKNTVFADNSENGGTGSGGVGPPGPSGSPGASFRTGSGVPSNGLGNDGDSYLDTATGNIYTKAAGVYTITGAIPLGGVTDGDKGDITVTGTGTTWTIDNGVVTLAKMANMATGSVIARTTAGTGVPEVIAFAALKTAMAFVKADVGLGNVDNTSDANKPVSTATQTALNLKANAASPVFTGPMTVAGPTVYTSNAMAALVIDTTFALNTKSISADSTFTFSGAPAATHSLFSMLVTNTDTSPHTLTLPANVFSIAQNAVVTTVVIPASGRLWLFFEYNSTGPTYTLTGDSAPIFGPTVSIASATTTNIGSAGSPNVSITGTTTITGFGTVVAGTLVFGKFTGVLTLTYNAVSLIIPGSASITTAAGDSFVARSLGSGNWEVLFYQKASGAAISGGGSGTVTHSLGALTLNALVLGNGSDDTKVVAGITSDGTSRIQLGVAGSSVGGAEFRNATSGTISIVPTTGALGTVVLTLPALTGTVALTTNNLSVFAATTSAQLAGVISDETGTGSLVFGTSPTLTGMITRLNALPGTDDTYEGTVIIGRNAGATIAQWEAVYLDASGTWQLADANGSGTFPCRGLAVAAYASTNAATVIDDGVVRNDAWTWTIGGDIYLSTTAGGLTQTAPSTSGDKVQKIGYALSADSIRVNIGSGEYLTVA